MTEYTILGGAVSAPTSSDGAAFCCRRAGVLLPARSSARASTYTTSLHAIVVGRARTHTHTRYLDMVIIVSASTFTRR